jgi:hypothetical protein
VLGNERSDQTDPLSLLHFFLPLGPQRVNAIIHQADPVQGLPQKSEDQMILPEIDP